MEHLCDFLNRKFLLISKSIRCSLLICQACEDLFQLFIKHMPIINSLKLRRNTIVFFFHIRLLRHIFIYNLTMPIFIFTEIVCHRKKPCRKTFSLLITVSCFINTKKQFLKEIICQSCITGEHPHKKSLQSGSVSPIKFLKGFFIPFGDKPFHKLLIRFVAFESSE